MAGHRLAAGRGRRADRGGQRGGGTPRCLPAAGCGADPAKLSLTGIHLGQAVVAILAVLAISGEYSTGMIRITLTAMPRRLTVLAAKAVVVTGLVLAAGTRSPCSASVLAGRLILPGHGFTPAHGYPPLSLGDGPTLRAAAGSVLYLALIALLSLGHRHRRPGLRGGHRPRPRPAVPVPDRRRAHLQPALTRHLEQIGPMTAGLDIQATTG